MSASPPKPDGATRFEQALASGRDFEEPWHAEAFALAIQLCDQGQFSWREWSETLGSEIAELAERGGEDCFVCWLNVIETLVDRKAIASRAELASMADAWRDAYRTTPHGQPVRLRE